MKLAQSLSFTGTPTASDQIHIFEKAQLTPEMREDVLIAEISEIQQVASRAAEEGKPIGHSPLLYLGQGRGQKICVLSNEKHLVSALEKAKFSIIFGAQHNVLNLIRTIENAQTIVVSDVPELSLVKFSHPNTRIIFLGEKGQWFEEFADELQSHPVQEITGEKIFSSENFVDFSDIADALELDTPASYLPQNVVSSDDFTALKVANQAENIFISSDQDKLPIYTFFEQAEGADTLIVLFHGGLEPSFRRLPHYEWRRTLQDYPAHKLFISDPTLTLSPKLKNGWYFGTESEDIIPRLKEIVKEIAQRCGASKILLVGSSAGGVAAFQVAQGIPGSLALGYSLQRSLGFGPMVHVPGFYEHVLHGIDFETAHAQYGSRVAVEDLFSAENSYQGEALWIQNLGDAEHMRDHYGPIVQQHLPQGGLGEGSHDLIPGKLRAHVTYWGNGHPVPPPSFFKALLDSGVNYLRNGQWREPQWQGLVPPPTPQSQVNSHLLPPVLSNKEALEQPQKTGIIYLEGKATTDAVALKIGERFYQAVKTNDQGEWKIEQSFAPATGWRVSLHGFDTKNNAISAPYEMKLQVVR